MKTLSNLSTSSLLSVTVQYTLSWDYFLDHLFLFLFCFSPLSSWLSARATFTTAVIILPTPSVIRDVIARPVDGTAANASNTRAPCGLKAPWSYTLESHINVAPPSTAPCSGHSASSSCHRSSWETPCPSPPPGICSTLMLRSLLTCWRRRHQQTQMGGYWDKCFWHCD